MKKKALILLISLFISFCFTELFFRIFYPINIQGWYAEILKKEKSFVALKKNYYHKIDRWNYDYYASYTLGKYRNRITQKKDINNDKVLILGDSFTFGLYLKDKNTYINKLQNKFNNLNLINSSTPGWSLEDYYLFTKNFCKMINPKKIIIILNDGDLARIKKGVIMKSTKKDSFKEKYFVYKFLIKNFMSFAFLRDSVYKIINTKKDVQKKDYEGTNIYLDQDSAKEVLKDTKKIFILLKKVSTDCNASLNVINLSWNNPEKKKNLYDPKQLLSKNEFIFFKDNRINFFDNTKYLKHVRNNKQKYIIKNEGHPNEHGADEIFKSLLIHFKKILS